MQILQPFSQFHFCEQALYAMTMPLNAEFTEKNILTILANRDRITPSVRMWRVPGKGKGA